MGLFLDSTPFHWSIYLLLKVAWLCVTLWDPMNPIEFFKPEYYDPNEYQGEGNGTPLQYSCLENPMDGGAWWAVVHGVAKSRT